MRRFSHSPLPGEWFRAIQACTVLQDVLLVASVRGWFRHVRLLDGPDFALRPHVFINEDDRRLHRESYGG